MTKKELVRVIKDLPDDYEVVLTDDIFPVNGEAHSILKGRHILAVGMVDVEKKIFLFVHHGAVNFIANQ
jgi:hypothetical protein